MNKVILIGRFVRDPEIRYTPNDKCCANFSIAVDRKYKQEGQQDADFPPSNSLGKNCRIH